MRPAGQVNHAGTGRDGVVAVVAIGHQGTFPVGQQAFRYAARTAGVVVEQDDGTFGFTADLHPHVGRTLRWLVRFLEHLHRRFIAVDERTVVKVIAQQVEQRLDQRARLDHPARQGLARDADLAALQHALLDTIQGHGIDKLERGDHGQGGRAGNTPGNRLSRHRRADRRVLAASTGVAHAHMTQHAHLHRHDIQLFAHLAADFLLNVAAGTDALRFGQGVHDLDAWKIGWQRTARAARARRSRGLRRVGLIVLRGRDRISDRLGFVEQKTLARRVLGAASIHPVPGQAQLFQHRGQFALCGKPLALGGCQLVLGSCQLAFGCRQLAFGCRQLAFGCCQLAL